MKKKPTPRRAGKRKPKEENVPTRITNERLRALTDQIVVNPKPPFNTKPQLEQMRKRVEERPAIILDKEPVWTPDNQPPQPAKLGEISEIILPWNASRGEWDKTVKENPQARVGLAPQPATPAELSADAERVMLDKIGDDLVRIVLPSNSKMMRDPPLEIPMPKAGEVRLLSEKEIKELHPKSRQHIAFWMLIVMFLTGGAIGYIGGQTYPVLAQSPLPVLHASQEPYKVPTERHPCSYYAPQGYVWDREAHACLKDGAP